MTPLGELDRPTVERLRKLVGDHATLQVYLNSGLDAVRNGATNRFARIGRDGDGAVLGIIFDGVEVRTTIGRLAPDEELALADVKGRASLHVEAPVAARVLDVIGPRLEGTEALRYYQLEGRPRMASDPRCRRLGPADLDAVRRFFLAHYPDTIFSAWMLEQPFLALFEDGAVAACGGVIAMTDKVANIGNFLTAPSARNRGFARAIAATLVHLLADRGVTVSTLGTNDENPAACRAYESIGFRCFEHRIQLNLAPQ